MRDTEAAWAAGLFEGEGSISFYRGRFRLALGMTDGDVVERFASVVGCGTVYVREEMRQAHWKPCWYWDLNKQEDCVALMTRLLPFLGTRRTARWNEVLEMRATLRPPQVCPVCEESFKPVRTGQVCCGHPCSGIHSKRVGPYGGKALMSEATKARMSVAQKARRQRERSMVGG